MRRLGTVAAMLDPVCSKWNTSYLHLPVATLTLHRRDMDLEEFLTEWRKEIEKANRPAGAIVKSRSGELSTYYF